MNHAAVLVNPPFYFSTWPVWLRKLLRKQSDGLAPQWQGGWLLAAGGQGTASLWVTYDEDNRVDGRMVVKSVVFGHDVYWDPICWSDGLAAAGYRDYNAPINHTIPLEAVVQRRLTQLAGAPVAPQTENPICQYLGHSAVDQVNRRYKLFMEYCAFGTLHELLRDHRATGAFLFPEPFYWYVAEQCLLAAKIMEQGGTAAAVAGWRSLIHRDIKPANVLLGPRDMTQFPHYPRIKLCDFGLTVETDENDVVNNPVEFVDQGTPGYLAPEQHTWYKKNGKLDLNRRLYEKTQIWSIGFMCWTLYKGPATPDPNFNDVNSRVPFVHGLYPEFRNFLNACMRYDPAQRPTIDEALALVQAPITGRDNFLGMRTAEVAVPLSRDTNMSRLQVYPKHEHDPYRLKIARGALPALR